MSVPDYIKSAFIEYDRGKPLIQWLLKNSTYTDVQNKNNSGRTLVRFRDKATQEIILESEVETLGVYFDKMRIWQWGWARPGIREAEANISTNILKWALNQDLELSYIKNMITAGRGEVTDEVQIEALLAICGSTVKNPFIFPQVIGQPGRYLIFYHILLNKQNASLILKQLQDARKVPI